MVPSKPRRLQAALGKLGAKPRTRGRPASGVGPGQSQTYQVTPYGRQVAALFTKAHVQVLAPGLALLSPNLPTEVRAHSPVAGTRSKFDLPWRVGWRNTSLQPEKLDLIVKVAFGKWAGWARPSLPRAT